MEFFPLVASYNGAIAEDTWRSFMDRLELDDKSQTKVLYTAAQALCVGFSTMVDIRLSSFANIPAGRPQDAFNRTHQATLVRPQPTIVP